MAKQLDYTFTAPAAGQDPAGEAMKLLAESLASEPEQVSEASEINAIVDQSLAESKRLDNKPNIDFLEDALDSEGNPKFKEGSKIVIERFMGVLPGNRWLDTRLLVVKRIDPVTGDMDMEDPDLRQNVFCNFIKGPLRGYRFKLAPNNGKLSVRKQRGRPRSALPKPEKPVKLDANGNVIKGKRGRPKGTKNRPKEEINAEKATREAERKAKRDAKLAKKKFR